MRDDIVSFVRSYFDSHDPVATDLKVRYPFRRRFGHCLRCSAWARRIATEEGGDIEIVETAALFHDIGKSGSQPHDDHGAAGAIICAEYLKSIAFDAGKRDIIVSIVSNHSQHARSPEATVEEKIVSDADGLDETGAIAILWDAMACALEPSPSYEKAYERSLRLTVPLKESLPPRLHTKAAQRIAQARFSVVEAFLGSLRYELGYDENEFQPGSF